MCGWRPRAATRRCSISALSGALTRVRAGLLHASPSLSSACMCPACLQLVCSTTAAPVRHAVLAPQPCGLPTLPLPAHAGSSPCRCHVTLEQEVHPKGLPPFFHNAFRAMAALQVRAAPLPYLQTCCLHCKVVALPADLLPCLQSCCLACKVVALPADLLPAAFPQALLLHGACPLQPCPC